jgi:hypothetical protein
LFNKRQQILAQCRKKLNRNQIGRLFLDPDKIYEPSRYVLMEHHATTSKTIERKKIGPEEKDFILFQKSYLEKVYPYTEPNPSDYIKAISTEISRNECKPLTFSIRPFRDLGRVQISMAPLRGAQGTLDADSIRVGRLANSLKSWKRKKKVTLFITVRPQRSLNQRM